MNRKVLPWCAMALIGASTLANADAPAAARQQSATATVKLADLDLTTTVGMAQARRRIVVTAERLCRRWSDDRKISDRATYTDCVHDTMAAAMERMRAPVSSVADNR